MSFSNYEQMMASISSGSIPSYVKLLLYDDEKWPATPVAQQQQPFTYEAEAETLAHQHGLGFVFTPAVNLSTVLSTAYSNATKYDGYTSLGIASQGAAHADVLEIQSQQDEGTSGFNSFVSSTVSQAKAANPCALVMAGLTTVAPGLAIIAPDLARRLRRDEAAGLGLLAEYSRGTRGSSQPSGRCGVSPSARSATRLLTPKLWLSGRRRCHDSATVTSAIALRRGAGRRDSLTRSVTTGRALKPRNASNP